MQLMVFSVFDKAVGAFMPPFMSRSKGEAVRSFTEAANDEKTQFNKHAMDYVLMFLGEFDDNSGLYNCAEPSRIIAAHEVLREDFAPPEGLAPGAQVRRLPM